MKKFLLGMVCAISFFSVHTDTYALDAENFTPAIEKKLERIQNFEQKVQFLQNLTVQLTSDKYVNDENSDFYDDIRQFSVVLLESIQELLPKETMQLVQKTIDLPNLSDNFSNIDEQRVREEILSWHNDERKSLWRNAYTYNMDLEWSATTWANKLAESGKTYNLHPRQSWDWYYNYDSMLNRFLDLWIEFPRSSGWSPSFSESIWYNYYKCSKSDCTEDLISAVKKTWTWLIMKEKASNASHYRAATMKHFTQMWVGVAIDESHNRYYVVFHYGVEI